MNELALFAGSGGGLLASRLLGWRTVCAVERDPYRRAVLLARQEDGLLDPFPIWSDVRTFDGLQWRGIVDIVTAGFPCQPFSVAGKRAGADDERNGWPDTIRIIREVRPRFAFLENVPGLLSSGYFGTVLGDLASAGLDAEWCVLGADDCGAPHRRKRLWIMANADDAGRGKQRRSGPVREELVTAERCCSCGRRARPWCHDPAEVGDSEEQREREPDDEASAEPRGNPRRSACGTSGRETQPRLGRVAHGVADRIHRLSAIGDGQVPLVAATAFRILYGRLAPTGARG